MNKLASLRIHAFIESINRAADWTEIKLKFDHRHDIQGECRFSLWTNIANNYFIGQEFCCIPGIVGPTGCLQIRAHIENISNPFDHVKWVELKLKLDPRDDINGTCRWRICPTEAADCYIGQEVNFLFTAVTS